MLFISPPFGNYIYLSESSPDLNLHFVDYAKKIIKKFKPKKKSTIIDIGSNDGSFLLKFNQKQYNLLGIDPSKLSNHSGTA